MSELKCCKACGAFYTCKNKGECCPECEMFDSIDQVCLKINEPKPATPKKIINEDDDVDPDTFLFEDDDEEEEEDSSSDDDDPFDWD